MRRALALLLLPAAACSFRSPAASGDGGVGGDDAPIDFGGEQGRCELGASWEQGKQPTKTVYVTANASNGGNGSQAKPYPTLADAIPDITPGTRILLAAGTYSGATVTSKQGTLDAPIWIEGPSTGGAKIMGGGGPGIWIGGDSDVGQFRPPLSATTGNTEATNVRVFDNLIRDVEDGIKCSNCTASLVAHNLIRGVSAYAFKLDQPYTSLGSFAFAPAGGVRFVNNAIEVGSSAEAFGDGGSGTDAASCTFTHNLWLQAGDAAWKPTLPSTETLGVYGKPSGYTDAGALCASAASPAAGAGAPVPGVTGTLQRRLPPVAAVDRPERAGPGLLDQRARPQAAATSSR